MGKVRAAAGLLSFIVAVYGADAVASRVDEPPPDEVRAPARLETVLTDWARGRRPFQDAHYTFTLTEWDGLKAKRTVQHGEVSVHRPDWLRVDVKDAQGQPALVVVCQGEDLRAYDFDRTAEWRIRLPMGVRFPRAADRCGARPAGFGEAVLEGSLWLFLALPAEGLGQRFVVRLEKEDDSWSYVRLDPKKRQGWLPDEEWQVVLDKQKRWLRRARRGSDWQGHVTVVDFDRPDHAPPPPGTWDPPFKKLPEGWNSFEWSPRGTR